MFFSDQYLIIAEDLAQHNALKYKYFEVRRHLSEDLNSKSIPHTDIDYSQITPIAKMDYSMTTSANFKYKGGG